MQGCLLKWNTTVVDILVFTALSSFVTSARHHRTALWLSCSEPPKVCPALLGNEMAPSPRMSFLTSCSLKPLQFWYLTPNMTTIIWGGTPASPLSLCFLFHLLLMIHSVSVLLSTTKQEEWMCRAVWPKLSTLKPRGCAWKAWCFEQSSQVLRPNHCYCWSSSALLSASSITASLKATSSAQAKPALWQKSRSDNCVVY